MLAETQGELSAVQEHLQTVEQELSEEKSAHQSTEEKHQSALDEITSLKAVGEQKDEELASALAERGAPVPEADRLESSNSAGL